MIIQTIGDQQGLCAGEQKESEQQQQDFFLVDG